LSDVLHEGKKEKSNIADM
jgi:hypothetical protein